MNRPLPSHTIDADMLNFLLDESGDPQKHLEALATEIAVVDKRLEPQSDLRHTTQRFLTLLQNNVFLPAPSILLEGAQNNPILFRNTALAVSDDFDQIFNTLKKTSLLLQNGIKVALDFSSLRAARSLIRSSHLQSVGPVRFMELFECAPQDRKDKTNLHFLLRVDHLDLDDYLAFVSTASPHLNFALGITDEFIRALSEQGGFGLKHKIHGETSKFVSAESILDKLTQVIFTQGRSLDFVFVDHLSRFRQDQQLSEETLLSPQYQMISPQELYATGTLNLHPFVSEMGWDEIKLEEAVFDAIHFLDNCFEKNFYLDDESRSATRQNLRIGLSVVGLGEALQVLNPDGNERKMRKNLDKIQDLLMMNAISASQKLGEKRGRKNRIFYKGRWHNTRHTQLLAQVHLPLLSQLAGTPAYLFLRGMSFKDLLAMHSWHAHWQKDLGNVASFKHSLKGLDRDHFKLLLTRAHELKFLTLEFS